MLHLNVKCDKDLDLAEIVALGMVNQIRQEKEIHEGKESKGLGSRGGGGANIIVDGIWAFIAHISQVQRPKKEGISRCTQCCLNSYLFLG